MYIIYKKKAHILSLNLNSPKNLSKQNPGRPEQKYCYCCPPHACGVLPGTCYFKKMKWTVLLHLYQQVKKSYSLRNRITYQLVVWSGLPSSLWVGKAQTHAQKLHLQNSSLQIPLYRVKQGLQSSKVLKATQQWLFSIEGFSFFFLFLLFLRGEKSGEKEQELGIFTLL